MRDDLGCKGETVAWTEESLLIEESLMSAFQQMMKPPCVREMPPPIPLWLRERLLAGDAVQVRILRGRAGDADAAQSRCEPC